MTAQIIYKNKESKDRFHFCLNILKTYGRKGALLFLLVVFSLRGFAQTGSWTPITHTSPHYNAGVMLLLTNGTVICKTSSGGTGYGTRWDKLTPDIHGSYVNGTWTTIAAMANERLYFSTQVLPDGRVYAAGGEYGAGGTKGEVYNPLNNTWTATPQIVTANAISDANSEILPNGKVLQAVVDTANTKLNYLWCPATNTYAHTASCLRRDNEAVWVKLPDNSVIFLDNYSTTSERYIPATNTWINDATAPVSVYDPYGDEAGGAFMLPDGRVWFIGSTPTSAYYTPSGSTSLGSWAAGPAIPGIQGSPDAASSMMPNGHILLAVSPTPTAADNFPDSTAFYEFDYTTNTYTLVSAPGVPGDTVMESSYVTNMLSLPDGTILFANQGDDQYYEYVPGSAPLAAGKPSIDSTIRISCDTFMATGKLFNGITEGASYGDDWQMNTNYPIIRLTSGTNVYYATTYHWNRIGAVMTGSLEDTTTFVIPATLPAGAYTLEVVVNGNPSASVPFNNSFAVSPSAVTLCQGYTSTLTDVWPGGTWSSASTAIATIDPVSGLLTGAGAGTTLITYTKGACFATATATVNASPAAITPLGAAVCVNATLLLSDATTGGAWSSSATGIATIDISGNITGVSAGAVNISYTNAGCAAVASVAVNPVPTATISPSGTIAACPSTSVTLNANTGAGLTYQWYSGAGIITGATNAAFTFSAATDHYSVVVTEGACQATSLADIVTVSSGTATPISGATGICTLQNTTLSDATAGGTWSSSNTAVATVSSSGVVYGVTAGPATISYTVSGSCSIPVAATYAMTISIPPVIAPVTGSYNACTGSATSLSDATASGVWSSSNTGIATINSSGSVTGVTGGTAIISYVVTSGTGCASATTATVTVNAPPSASVTPSGSVTVCAGGSTALSLPTGSGLSYQWKNGASIIPGATTATYLVTAAGSYTGIVTNNSTACNATSSAVTVTAIASVTPAVTVASSTGASVCAGTSSIFTATPVNGGSAPVYNWFVNSVSVSSGSSFAYSPVNGDIVRCLLTSNATCALPDTTSDHITMTVATGATPLVSIIASPHDTVCTGDTIRYIAVPVFGGTAPSFSWQLNGVTAGTGPSLFSATPHDGDVVKVDMFSNYTCLLTSVASSSLLVTHVDLPVANTLFVSATSMHILAGQADTFTASAPNAGSAAIYRWFINGVQVTGANSAVFITTTLVDGDVVTCAVTSSDICAAPGTVVSGGILIGVTEGVNNISRAGGLTLIPNPNNGTFVISGTLSTPGNENVSIVITDMLGQTVYKTITLSHNGNVNDRIILPETLADGMYLVNITSGADHAVFHMVVNK